MEKMKWILLLIVFLITNAAFGQSEHFSAEIDELMQKYGAIGLSVAVVRDSKIVYSNSFGYKNREEAVLLDPSDLFRIASITKTFVATAIMQLVEKKKLSLDDDINNYLSFKVQNPQFQGTPITVKMLLCHRSSINDSQGYKTFKVIDPSANPQYVKCYNAYEPGSSYAYCNLNYNLLGAIIENVTGERFDRYIYRKIVRPLGLHGRFNVMDLDSTLFVSSYRYDKNQDSLVLDRNTYLPYRDEINHYQLGYSVPYLSAAAGMKISVTELARYMIMHMNKGKYKWRRIISDKSELEMRQVPVPKHWYALSLSHYYYILPDEELIGQTGGDHGIHTAMIFHPEKKYGFVVFCNGCKSGSADGHELNFEVIKLLNKYFI